MIIFVVLVGVFQWKRSEAEITDVALLMKILSVFKSHIALFFTEPSATKTCP
jgi:hypothetical protein